MLHMRQKRDLHIILRKNKICNKIFFKKEKYIYLLDHFLPLSDVSNYAFVMLNSHMIYSFFKF